MARGVQEYKEGIRMFTTAFPDIDLQVDEVFAEDDTVDFRLSVPGSHDGPFMGVEPTGNEVSFTAFDSTPLEDGKVVEEWFTMDTLGLLEQLGAVGTDATPPFEE